jgi:hypothetical protein
MKNTILNFGFLFLFAIIGFVFSGFSQIEYNIYDFSSEFENSQQNARAVFPSPEGGYLVFGNTGAGFYSDTSKVFVLKTDENGIVEWINVIGQDTKLNYFNHVAKTPSNRFMAVGHHKEIIQFSEPVHQLIAQFGETGTANWLMYHDWEWDDELQGIVQGNNGNGYVVIGSTQSYGAGSPNQYNIFMMKTDENGNEINKTVLDGGYDDFGYAVANGLDDGYIFAGVFESGKSLRDIYIIRTDENLDTIWTNRIDAIGSDYPFSIERTSDNKYIVAGQTNSYGSGRDAFLLKIDDEGNVEWLQTYGGEQDDFAFDVIETMDNNYLLCGKSKSWTDDSQVYIVKTDTDGNEIWSEIIPYENGSNVYSVYETSMNHYVLAGYFKGISGDYKAMIVDVIDQSASLEDIQADNDFYLSPCYPNPFKDETTIEYRLDKKTDIQLTVFNVMGIEVKTLVKEKQVQGEYHVKIGKRDFPPGIYFYRLSNGRFSQVRKMTMID